MWLYKTREFTDENIGDAVGFVYCITNVLNGRKYIGKKLFTKAGRKQVKGKVKKIRKQSDWQDYYGSNEELKKDVEELGKDKFLEKFHFEVLGNYNYQRALSEAITRILRKNTAIG